MKFYTSLAFFILTGSAAAMLQKNEVDNCCLCNNCDDVAVTKQAIQVLDSISNSLVTCQELIVNLFDSNNSSSNDSTCAASIAAHRTTCCVANAPVPAVHIVYDKNDEHDLLHVVLPDDLSLYKAAAPDDEDKADSHKQEPAPQNESMLSRWTRTLFTSYDMGLSGWEVETSDEHITSANLTTSEGVTHVYYVPNSAGGTSSTTSSKTAAATPTLSVSTNDSWSTSEAIPAPEVPIVPVVPEVTTYAPVPAPRTNAPVAAPVSAAPVFAPVATVVTTTAAPVDPARTYAAAPIRTSSDGCCLCTNCAEPTNPTQGVVIQHASYTYGPGTCGGLNDDIYAKLKFTDQMCKPTRAELKQTCCIDPPGASAANNGMGSWSVGDQTLGGAGN